MGRHDGTADGSSARSLAKVVPGRRAARASLDRPGADDVGRRLLQNDELIQPILNAINDMGPPMSVDAFKARLDRMTGGHRAACD